MARVGFSLSADKVLELIAPLIAREEANFNKGIEGLKRLQHEKDSRIIEEVVREYRNVNQFGIGELKEIQSVARCAKELGIDAITLDADALRLIGLLTRDSQR